MDLGSLAAILPPPERTLYEAYCEQDRLLVEQGWHPTTELWLDLLRRFWEHPTAYRLVGSLGRRAGKSTTLERVSVCEIVDRDWHVPPGQVHCFPFFSIKKGEAAARLVAIEAVLRARGIDFKSGGDDMGKFVRLLDRPLEWRALPASFRTAVGFTSVGFCADELARWNDSQASANPAKHILKSVRPSIASHLKEGAHEYLISSAWAEEGAHFEAMDRGDNSKQVTCTAATWDANPTLSIDDCIRLCEEDEEQGESADLDRDYRSIPMKLGVLGKLDPGLIKWLDEPPMPLPTDMCISGSDLGMKVNSSAQALGYIRGDHYTIAHLQEWRPTAGVPLKPSAVCEAHRDNLQDFGAEGTCADGHYRESLWEALSGTSLIVFDAPPSSQSVVRLRALMQGSRLSVFADGPTRKRLSDQLRGTRIVPTVNGVTVKMETAQDGNHCDLVAALANCVWLRAGPAAKLEPVMTEHEKRKAQLGAKIARERRGDEDWL